MPPSPIAADIAAKSIARRALGARLLGTALGSVLLLAALIYAWAQRDTVTAALRSVQQPSAAQAVLWIAVLLATVIANLVLTGAMFSMLMSRYQPLDPSRRVGVIEMQALIASSTLLNFVPFRPGLLGRVAYHRLYNDIPVSSSAKTIAQAVAISAMSAAYMTCIVLLVPNETIALTAAAAAPALIFAALSLMPGWGMMFGASAVRWIDLLMIALRYYAAFALLGLPIEPRSAMGFACISVIASLVPFLSNGLGLREWAVGVFAPVLTTYQMSLGVTADLLTRAAEIVVIVPAGLLGAAIITKRRKTLR